MKFKLVCLLCCLISPTYLAAEVLIYDATGVINYVYNGGTEADGLVLEGERFTMRFTLDTEEGIGFIEDNLPFSETYHYFQSYSTSVDFSGGLSLVATPQPGIPWWSAENARTAVYVAENPGDPVFRLHHSGQNSPDTDFVFNTPITVDWIDLVYRFLEYNEPYELLNAELTSLPALSDFDENSFSLFFQNWNDTYTLISGYFDSLVLVPSLPIIECIGFYAPFDEPMMVERTSKRALPLKFNLFDEFGEVTDLSPPPIVEISVSNNGNTGSDVPGYDEDLLPPGLSDDSNEFRYDPESGQWILNLGMKPYTASATYTISAIAGDGSYIINGCTETFTRK